MKEHLQDTFANHADSVPHLKFTATLVGFKGVPEKNVILHYSIDMHVFCDEVFRSTNLMRFAGFLPALFHLFKAADDFIDWLLFCH